MNSGQLYGLLGFVLPEVQYLEMPGVDGPFVPLADPGDEPAPTPAGAWTVWKYHKDAHKTEQSMLHEATLAWYNSLDPTTQKLMHDAGGRGIRTRSLAWMMIRFRTAYGTMSSDAITTITDRLDIPYDPATPLVDFISTHTDVHLRLIENNQPLSEQMKVAKLKSAIQRNTGENYKQFFPLYNQQFPLLQNQTFESFETAVLSYSRTLPAVSTTSSLGYGAAVQPAMYTQAQVDTLVAAAVARATTSTTKGEKVYCYTHGYQYSHNSEGCNTRCAEHKESGINPKHKSRGYNKKA